MDNWRLKSNDIPKILYRVQLPESATIYDDGFGFSASDNTSFYSVLKKSSFRASLASHLNWTGANSRRDTIPDSVYISLFSDFEHAVTWANEWSELNESKPAAVIYTILGRQLDDVWVFKATDFLSSKPGWTPIDLVGGEEAHADEYLVLHDIPASATMSDVNGNAIITVVPTINLDPPYRWAKPCAHDSRIYKDRWCKVKDAPQKKFQHLALRDLQAGEEAASLFELNASEHEICPAVAAGEDGTASFDEDSESEDVIDTTSGPVYVLHAR